MDDKDNNTLGTLPDSQGYAVLCALRKLLNGLSTVRRKADHELASLERERRNNPQDLEARRAAIRRNAAKASLDWALSFLESPPVASFFPGLLERGVSRHLFDLMQSLDDVAAGTPAVLFQPPATGERGTSPTDEEFRAKAAVLADLLVSAGSDLDEACTEVARQLDEIGYRKPYGRKGETGNNRITGATVRYWRKKAKEASQDTRIGEAFRFFSSYSDYEKAKGFTPGQVAWAMLKTLAMQLPGGRDLLTTIKRPPQGEK